jgi:hypothetical protein
LFTAKDRVVPLNGVVDSYTNIMQVANQKGDDNPAKAAAHTEAAKHHQIRNHEKAATCAVQAPGHSCLANEQQKEAVKYHTAKF